MRTTLPWLSLTAVLLCSAGATAEQQDLSVLVLHHICHDTDARSKSSCSGFLIGLIVGLQMSAKMSREGKPVCVPGALTPDKLIVVLDKMVTEKPEFAALPGLEAMAVVLQTVFPCRPPPVPPKK